MDDFLATVPFDLYELALFRLVATHGSFTKAAESAGLTQSAITRQMQGLEHSLGVELLERTTRSVRLTPAGEYLLREAAQLLGNVDQTLRGLREGFTEGRKEVRVGVSRTIGLAYLPGFFHANLRWAPQVACRVSYLGAPEILHALEANELDLGVLCPPQPLPRALKVTHRFDDAFTILTSSPAVPSRRANKKTKHEVKAWVAQQTWLMIEEATNTGRRLSDWCKQQGWQIQPSMQLDSFDLIINLVALGMGASLVPIRALALYGRKRALQRLPIKERFVRELVVVTRRRGKTPAHLAEFVANILF